MLFRSVVSSRARLSMFMGTNSERLARDMSVGKGETLEVLANLLNIKAEDKANDLEEKIKYIEQFGPILVEGLARITGAKEDRKVRARDGLMKILGRDTTAAAKDLNEANKKLEAQRARDSESGSEAEE